VVPLVASDPKKYAKGFQEHLKSHFYCLILDFGILGL
jgi:hypothetical protein